jgi:hypothetical protein
LSIEGDKVELLIRIGGKEWLKDEFHRIYFNDLHELYGLECVYFSTGDVQAAWLDGERISNTRGQQLEKTLENAKVWYDVILDGFFSKGLDEEQHRKILLKIKEKILEIEVGKDAD